MSILCIIVYTKLMPGAEELLQVISFGQSIVKDHRGFKFEY